MDPPRSVLYVPASRPDFVSKIPGLAADLVVVDLEDGVAPEGKDAARNLVARETEAGRLDGGPPWMVRVNALGSPWHDADLRMVESLRPRAAVLPKAEDIMAVQGLARRLAERDIGTALMIETAAGVSKAPWLAGAHTRVEMLIYGSADLRLSLGARPDDDRRWERHALGSILVAARANGCAAIDSVCFRYRDDRRLEAEARVARDLGFDGKSCIHPAQLPVVHRVFASTPEEVAWAEAVIRAWDEQDGSSRGVVVVEGEMIESLHVAVARRLLARAPGPDEES